MRKCISAILLSVLFHALLAVGLIAYLEYAPHPDVLATLDLSSVELSFAEEEAETAAVAALPQDEKKPSEEKPVEEKPVEEKPAEEKTETPVHREPEEAERHEPREDVRPQTEDVKEKDVRQETKDEVRTERETPREERPEPKETPRDEKPEPKETVREEKRETRDESKAVRPMPAPKQARLDAPPRPKRNIRPDYPKGARQRGEQGEVVLEIRVNAEGSVDDVKVAVSSGFAELDDAAVRAAKAAKFSPARSGRERVASTARLKLQFKLR